MERFRESGKLETGEPSESYHPEEARRAGWSHRSTFLYTKRIDDDPQEDGLPNEPGRVEARGRELRYEGDVLQGELVESGPHGVSLYQFEQGNVDVLQVAPNGRQVHYHIDLANPEQSTKSSQGTEEVPQDFWRPNAEPSSPATTSLAGVLAESGQLKSIYLDQSLSLPEQRLHLLKKLEAGLVDLGLAESDPLLGAVRNPRADSPLRLVHGLRGLLETAEGPTAERVRALRDQAADWMVLEDLPEYSADGLVRRMDHYIAPGTLHLATAARGWDVDERTGLPIADSVVIGAGPGGLASGYHLSEAGRRTVIFEGGRAGQAFSDKNAQSVHALRTNSGSSNLIYTGDNRENGVEVSLTQTFAQAQALSKEAREAWTRATGESFQGLSPAGVGVGYEPTNRAELYDHMSRIALGLSEHYPDTFLCEKSPVSRVEKQGSHYLVETAAGHRLLTRSLVVCTGFVGSHGEHARSLEQLERFAGEHSESTLWLPDDHHEVAASERLVRAQKSLDGGRVSDNLVCSERLLGRPSVRSHVESLPPGSRIGVVGGGESAVKAVAELLHLNPEISVDLYTPEPLEAYQTQLPASHLNPALMETLLAHGDLAEKSLEQYRAFGTPVTPRTLKSLFDAEGQGRLRIRSLGEHFSPETVQLSSRTTERGQAIGLSLTSPRAAALLQSQREAWVARGLYPGGAPSDSPTELPPVEMLVMAAGYDERSVRSGPLIRQLVDQGEIVLGGEGRPLLAEDGVTSAASSTVCFNTAGVLGYSGDSTLRGRAVRGFHVARALGRQLPEREPPEDRIPSGLRYFGVDTKESGSPRRFEADEALELLENNAFVTREQEFRASRMRGLEGVDLAIQRMNLETGRVFPDFYMTGLLLQHQEFPGSLSPSEQLVIEAGLAAAHKTALGSSLGS